MSIRLSVIIPAYNEEKRIAPTIRETCAYLAAQGYQSEVIVALNNCTDATAVVVASLEAEFPMLRHIDLGFVRSPSGTKGLAVAHGMRAACGEYRIYMDADNAAKIGEIEKLWPLADEGCDVVFGSRYVSGADRTVSWHRRALSRVGNLLIRALLLPGVRDTQCAFKLFTAQAAEAVFSRLTIAGWGFDMEALYIARSLGLSLREVPIVWREVGDSSLKARAFRTALHDLLTVRFRAWAGKYRSSR